VKKPSHGVVGQWETWDKSGLNEQATNQAFGRVPTQVMKEKVEKIENIS
jgi:hypothetical protein